MTQPPSQIMYTTRAGLRDRIEALVRCHLWNDDTADPRTSIPFDDLSWAVATNPAVLAGVTERIVDGNISDAVAQIPEGQLQGVVLAAWARLNGGTP